MCRLSTDLICLGSRLGDSLLIKFTQKSEAKLGREKTESGNSDDVTEPPEKRMRMSQDRERDQDRDGLIENVEKRDMDFLEEGECIFFDPLVSISHLLLHLYTVHLFIFNYYC